VKDLLPSKLRTRALGTVLLAALAGVVAALVDEAAPVDERASATAAAPLAAAAPTPRRCGNERPSAIG
jgi:hypothetical protein